METPKCPTDKWVKRRWDTHTMEYYSAIEKEGNSAIGDYTDGP